MIAEQVDDEPSDRTRTVLIEGPRAALYSAGRTSKVRLGLASEKLTP